MFKSKSIIIQFKNVDGFNSVAGFERIAISDYGKLGRDIETFVFKLFAGVTDAEKLLVRIPYIQTMLENETLLFNAASNSPVNATERREHYLVKIAAYIVFLNVVNIAEISSNGMGVGVWHYNDGEYNNYYYNWINYDAVMLEMETLAPCNCGVKYRGFNIVKMSSCFHVVNKRGAVCMVCDTVAAARTGIDYHISNKKPVSSIVNKLKKENMGKG